MHLTKLMIGLTLAVVMIHGSALSQVSKPALDYSVFDNWKSLGSQQVDPAGEWLSYEINPSVGDGTLYFQSWDGSWLRQFSRGAQARFGGKADFLAFRIKVQADTLRKAKLDKVKADDMPKDSLGLYITSGELLKKYPRLRSFEVAPEEAGWLAFQIEEAPRAKNDTTPAPKSKKKKEYKGVDLHLINPLNGDSIALGDVAEFGFTKKGNRLFAVSIEEDSLITSSLSLFDTRKGEWDLKCSYEGLIKKVVADEEGNQFAFLFSADTTKEKVYELYLAKADAKAPQMVVGAITEGLPENWCVSEHGRINFSKSGDRLFMGLAPKPEQVTAGKDSLLDEEKVFLDIWHWEEVTLQSMQLKQASRERNKSYPAVLHLKKQKLIRLGDPDFVESYTPSVNGDGQYALGLYDKPYALNNAITFSSHKDVYLLDMLNGSSSQLFAGISFTPRWSSSGRFLFWWEPADSSWYTHEVKSGKTHNVTKACDGSFAVDTDDRPDDPGSYGVMGWAADDASLFVYDKYDIWNVDPSGKRAPICITGGKGKDQNLQFRYVRLDQEEEYINPEKEGLFSVFNTRNKQSGFCRITPDEAKVDKLLMEDCRFGSPVKARETDKLIFTRSTVSEYPDMWTAKVDFSEAKKMTRANPQQDAYNWLTVELVEWMDFNGEMHQGLLYKPEDFDPAKKYPMMVYFYERHSDGLHSHMTPRASSSTINTPYFCSNGYLVFHPDIHYKVGFPGKSSYDAIVSGVMHLGHRSYVDMKRLGLQGQSWGGYETAWLITQTDLFAAASPGAPVVNMTSAYGGIRTESGMCRQVQYEKGQSRIGGSLWELPELYFENSPLFYADRINTPCLIRHNDNDGAVPFAQGVEFFVALRRLGKPAWLLNYNNDGHNLTTKLSNRKDLSVRMQQFFDHYLKDAPAPDWMTQGVKAVDKKSSETYYLQFKK